MGNHAYGWIKQSVDERDVKLTRPVALKTDLPPSVDLRPQMPPLYDQGQLGCHDDKTEVLTDHGWQRWSEYDGKALLATVRPETHELEYQVPTALQRYEYDGPLYYADHKFLDFALTPNHRMYVRPWKEQREPRERGFAKDYQFAEIRNVAWWNKLLAAPSSYMGTEFDKLSIDGISFVGDDFIALTALVASDGWVGGAESNANVVSFCCFREDRIDFVRALAQRLAFSEQPRRPGVFRKRWPEVAEWFRQNLFVGNEYRSPFKKVPALIKVASQRQIDHFLKFFGDQHVAKERQFYSSSQWLIDDLQELLLKMGKRSSIYERAPRTTQMKDGRVINAKNCTKDITLTEWNGERLGLERKEHLVVERYSGEVFCATVPNSMLITRREGRLLISGNSCSANAIAGAVEYLCMKSGYPWKFTPSRLYLYYNERALEGTIDQDAGAQLRDGLKSLNLNGICPESEGDGTKPGWIWPYSDGPDLFKKKPPEVCYKDAVLHRALKYEAVPNDVEAIMTVLAAGIPIIFGIPVYSSFESAGVAACGVVPMPTSRDSLQGGHAVLICGYFNKLPKTVAAAAKRVRIKAEPGAYVLVRNSWGENWGDGGHFYLPMKFVTKLGDDFWAVEAVGYEKPAI